MASMNSINRGQSDYLDPSSSFWSHPYWNISDSAHILYILQQYSWNPDYLLFSLDVASLYTSIPHLIGLTALEHFLNKDNLFPPHQISFLVELACFSLIHNFFLFQNQFYLQMLGTTMGASFAPCFANIFMGFLKNMAIWHENPFSQHIVYYSCYADDILIIWHGDRLTAESFLTHCNNNSFGIQSTSVIDPVSLVFLYLELFYNSNSNIVTRTHFKPSSGNSYLHHRS